METTRDLIEKVYDLSRLRIKIGLKRHSPIIFTIGTLFFLVFYSIPLLVVKGPISLLIIIFISGLSIILGKTRLINSKLTRYFILIMITILTAPLLLLF